MINRCTNKGQSREHILQFENALFLICEEEAQLKEELAAKQLEVDELNVELSSVAGTKWRFQRRVKSLRSAEPDVSDEAETETETGSEVDISPEAETYEEPVCGAASVDDIKDLKYQYEGLRRIAEMNGGILELSRGVDVVIAAMKPKGKKSSVVSTQGKRIRNSPDWTRIRKGVYRLKAATSGKISDVSERKQRPRRSGKSKQPQMDREAA